jgi:dienelactone hydrolase
MGFAPTRRVAYEREGDRMRARAWLVTVVALSLVGIAACSPRSSATIEVDKPVALADAPVHVRVSGLGSGDELTVSAQARDAGGKLWRSQAQFTADDGGVVDLDRAQPKSGTYQGVNGMGLFWSMNPPDGDPDQALYRDPDQAAYYPAEGPSFTVDLTVAVGDRQLATRSLTRQWLGDGVTVRTLRTGTDQVAGVLALPPAGSTPRIAVLAIGGSGGGVGMAADAALLASHGYPALALAYFRYPGRPDQLQDIPLEYFATAARRLAAASGVRRGRVATLGYSRGTEPAMLVGAYFPELISGVVVYAPTARAEAGFPNGGAAWTRAGKPIAAGSPIPVERLDGPILLLAGDDDKVWPSARSVQEVTDRLEGHRFGHPRQELVYPQAGHGVGTFPFQPAGTTVIHPVTGGLIALGGIRPANAAARRDGWPKMLEFLDQL